jgi:hypothetical protein
VFAPTVGISARGKSRKLQRVMTDFGAEHSFAAACARLKEHYGFELNPSAARTITLRHARRAAGEMRAQYAKSFRSLPKEGPSHVVAQADGTMICTVEAGRRKAPRPRQWREMRLVAARAQGSVEAVFGATFGDTAQAGQRWGHCARKAGWALSNRIHVVGDGAEWIRLQSREVFGDQHGFLIDFFHLSEYLAAASETCRGHAPKRWLKTQQERLKRGAAGLVLQALEAHIEPEAIAEENAPVRKAHRYLSNRIDCVDYPSALAAELPIGSGLIESGHRHVLQSRLKRPGTAWLQPNADDLAQLRVLRANNLWNHFWKAAA